MAKFTDSWETKQEKLYITKIHEETEKRGETKVKTAKLMQYLDRKMKLEYAIEHQNGYCPKCFCLIRLNGKCDNCD